MTLAFSHRHDEAVSLSSHRRPGLYLVPPLPPDDPIEAADARREAADGGPAEAFIPAQRLPTQHFPESHVATPPDRRSPQASVSNRRAARPVRRPVRLTRRGRIVAVVVLAGFVMGLIVLLAPPTGAASPAGPPRAVVVHAGDTMWSIATAALPHDDPGTAVDRIRVLNHLPDNRIYVGEQLLLPPS